MGTAIPNGTNVRFISKRRFVSKGLRRLPINKRKGPTFKSIGKRNSSTATVVATTATIVNEKTAFLATKLDELDNIDPATPTSIEDVVTILSECATKIPELNLDGDDDNDHDNDDNSSNLSSSNKNKTAIGVVDWKFLVQQKKAVDVLLYCFQRRPAPTLSSSAITTSTTTKGNLHEQYYLRIIAFLNCMSLHSGGSSAAANEMLNKGGLDDCFQLMERYRSNVLLQCACLSFIACVSCKIQDTPTLNEIITPIYKSILKTLQQHVEVEECYYFACIALANCSGGGGDFGNSSLSSSYAVTVVPSKIRNKVVKQVYRGIHLHSDVIRSRIVGQKLLVDILGIEDAMDMLGGFYIPTPTKATTASDASNLEVPYSL